MNKISAFGYLAFLTFICWIISIPTTKPTVIVEQPHNLPHWVIVIMVVILSVLWLLYWLWALIESYFDIRAWFRRRS